MKPDNGMENDPAIAAGCFDGITSPEKKQPSLIRKIAMRCVFGIGMAMIGVIAVPTVILCGIIYLLVQGVNGLIGIIADD